MVSVIRNLLRFKLKSTNKGNEFMEFSPFLGCAPITMKTRRLKSFTSGCISGQLHIIMSTLNMTTQPNDVNQKRHQRIGLMYGIWM